MRRLRLLGGHWSRGSTSHVMRIFGSDWIEKSHQRIKLTPLFGRLLVFAFFELIFIQLLPLPLKIQGQVPRDYWCDLAFTIEEMVMQAKKMKLFPKKQVLEEYFRNKTTLYFHPRESKIINWLKPVGLAYANLNFWRIFTYNRFIFKRKSSVSNSDEKAILAWVSTYRFSDWILNRTPRHGISDQG